MKRCAKCHSLMPDDVTECIKCNPAAAKKIAPAPVKRVSPPPPPVAPIKWTNAAGEKPGKIYGAWLLTVQSWRVLMLDKELLVFPLMSGIACFLVLATFFGVGLAMGVTRSGSAAANEVVSWGLLFAYYFVNYFVIVFFNSALVACAMIRFQGGNPTVEDGLRAAKARIPQIVAWALLAATVGVVLRVIQDRVPAVGKFVIGLLGAAWTIATYFIVPLLVIDKLGPLDAVKRSVTLMKQTWGETLVSNVGISLVIGIATFVFLIVAGAATVVLFGMTGSTGVLITCVVLIVACLVAVSLIGSALNTIVLSALYLYAAEKKVPQAFDGVAQVAFAPAK
jgi:hypothetical protein